MSVTDCADARPAPAGVVADLGRWPKKMTYLYRVPQEVMRRAGPLEEFSKDASIASIRTKDGKVFAPAVIVYPDFIAATFEEKEEANKALVPTPASVTPAADAPVAPDVLGQRRRNSQPLSSAMILWQTKVEMRLSKLWAPMVPEAREGIKVRFVAVTLCAML